MDIWSSYEDRMTVKGRTKRDTFLIREQHMLESKLPDSLSYHPVTIDDISCNIAIVSSSTLQEKTIFSTDYGYIRCGGLVFWADNYWLITELDADNEVYTRAKMQQCNYLLKWIDNDGVIHEQWCIVEDGTKYLTGEYEDRNFIVTRGDSRIAMTIAKNKDTLKFCRETRFLIDDPEADIKLAYLLTKPLKIGWSYSSDGVYRFVLQEVVSTIDDNHELGIADYYKYFPKPTDVTNQSTPPTIISPDKTIDDGRGNWL